MRSCQYFWLCWLSQSQSYRHTELAWCTREPGWALEKKHEWDMKKQDKIRKPLILNQAEYFCYKHEGDLNYQHETVQVGKELNQDLQTCCQTKCSITECMDWVDQVVCKEWRELSWACNRSIPVGTRLLSSQFKLYHEKPWFRPRWFSKMFDIRQLALGSILLYYCSSGRMKVAPKCMVANYDYWVPL